MPHQISQFLVPKLNVGLDSFKKPEVVECSIGVGTPIGFVCLKINGKGFKEKTNCPYQIGP